MRYARLISSLTLILFLGFLLGCGSVGKSPQQEPKNLITGKWISKDMEITGGGTCTVEFLEEGSFVLVEGQDSTMGEFMFTDEDHLQLNFTGGKTDFLKDTRILTVDTLSEQLLQFMDMQGKRGVLYRLQVADALVGRWQLVAEGALFNPEPVSGNRYIAFSREGQYSESGPGEGLESLAWTVGNTLHRYSVEPEVNFQVSGDTLRLMPITENGYAGEYSFWKRIR